MEARFPSRLELVASQALVLLASNLSLASKPPPSTSSSCCYEELPSPSSASDSTSSLLTTGDSSKQSRSNPLHFLAAAACCVEKPKKKRKMLKIVNCDEASKIKVNFYERKTQESMEVTSSTSEGGESSVTCGDSSSACIGSSRRGHMQMKRGVFRKKILRPSECSRLRPRAEAILKFLAAGRFPEYKIREAIGNSPDTSKALRM